MKIKPFSEDTRIMLKLFWILIPLLALGIYQNLGAEQEINYNCTWICTKCGYENDYRIKYCGICGHGQRNIHHLNSQNKLSTCEFEKELNVKRIYVEGHYYIYIGKAVLHDPDCGCQDMWIGIKRDDGTFIFRRLRPNDQD